VSSAESLTEEEEEEEKAMVAGTDHIGGYRQIRSFD